MAVSIALFGVLGLYGPQMLEWYLYLNGHIKIGLPRENLIDQTVLIPEFYTKEQFW